MISAVDKLHLQVYWESVTNGADSQAPETALSESDLVDNLSLAKLNFANFFNKIYKTGLQLFARRFNLTVRRKRF